MKHKAFLLGVILLLVLCGCSNEEQTQDTRNQPAEEKHASDEHGLELEKFIEVRDLQNFYYPDVTCSEDKLYLSFQSYIDGTGENENYAIVYDKDLKKIKGPVDLTSPFEGRPPGENYPDHVLVYNEGFLYGAFQSSLAIGDGRLIIAKYDEDLNLLKQVVASVCGPEQRDGNHICHSVTTCKNETFDSPMLSFSEERVHLLSEYHEDTAVDCDNEGLYVRTFDKDLNLIESFVLPKGKNPLLGHGDVVEKNGLYELIVNVYDEKEELELLSYDKSMNILSEQNLLPEEYDRLGKAGHSRAIRKDRKIYVGFIGAEGNLKSKKKEDFNVPNLYMAVFDENTNFERFLMVTNYDYEDYQERMLQPVPQKYMSVDKDNVYAVIGFRERDQIDEQVFSPFGNAVPRLILAKYKMNDKGTLPDVKGPWPE